MSEEIIISAERCTQMFPDKCIQISTEGYGYLHSNLQWRFYTNVGCQYLQTDVFIWTRMCAEKGNCIFVDPGREFAWPLLPHWADWSWWKCPNPHKMWPAWPDWLQLVLDIRQGDNTNYLAVRYGLHIQVAVVGHIHLKWKLNRKWGS